VFFGDEDCDLHRGLLSSQRSEQGVAVWAYCLMPNHFCLILVPKLEAKSFGPSTIRPVSDAFGVVRCFRLGGQHDGDGLGASVGPPLSASAQFDLRTAFDAVDDRMVEPIVDGVHPTGVHAAG
jgi:hypothetical protein